MQFFVPSLGWLSDPFKWLSDLQLGDEKVTLNHLVYISMMVDLPRLRNDPNFKALFVFFDATLEALSSPWATR